MTIKVITDTIDAENTFSDPTILHGEFNFTLAGTWEATVYLQKRYGSTGDWIDVETYSTNTSVIGSEPESDVYWRFGVKTGGFTSGAVAGRLSQ